MKFKDIIEKKEKQYSKRKDPRNVNIRIDSYKKNLFEVNPLTVHEINYLLDKGFKPIYQQDLFGKRDYYLIKPPENESFQHCFLVQIVKQTLEKNFEYVKELRTRKPDIIFRVRNKFIALEIETGKVLRRHKQRLLEKIETLNQDYGKDWFFVVTNRDLVPIYRKFGKTLTRKNLIEKLSAYVDFDIKNPHPQKPPRRPTVY